MKKRLLIVTQYFWPENMRINDLVEGFVDKGYEVCVLTGRPNYPEGKVYEGYRKSPESYGEYAGAKIYRVPMLSRGKTKIGLILNYLTFFICASIFGVMRLRGQKFNNIFVYAVSPIMAAIPAIIIGKIKKSPVSIWILDLWPETLGSVGVVKNQRIMAVVGLLVSWIYNRADYLLLQSKSFFPMVKKYCTKPVEGKRLVYFPSWAENVFSEFVGGESALLEKRDDVFTIVFAGNLGEAQDIPTIISAAETLKNEPLRWVFVGDGRMSSWLTEAVTARGLDNVILLGRHPLEEMPGIFKNSDALLMSLKTDDFLSLVIPAKLQAYMASAKPVVALVEGEAARVVSESGCGVVCNAGDPIDLADKVRSLMQLSQEELCSMGRRGKNHYEIEFSKNLLFSQLDGHFRSTTKRAAQ